MVTDPSTIDSMLQWFYNRYGFSSDDLTQDPHDVLSHLVFGFAPTYKGEIYAGVPEMVLQHTAYGDNSLISKRLGRRPTLEEVQKNLASFHEKLNSVFLEHRHGPWYFQDDGSQVPWDSILNKIVDLYKQYYGIEKFRGPAGWRQDYLNTVAYYKHRLIPPDKRLPPELFAYAEEHFGSMPPRDEEAVNDPIVDPEEMKRQFPQYAADMEHFCRIIDEYYGWEPFEDRYNRVVSQESREFIAQHEGKILAVFQEMEPRVKEIVSSLGNVKTLEPLSPEHIKELYDLCVRVDEYIKQQTDKYPHEMTLDEIRALPIELLVRIREEFPWPHFEEDQPSSVGAADDPRLEFSCLLAEREAYMR